MKNSTIAQARINLLLRTGIYGKDILQYLNLPFLMVGVLFILLLMSVLQQYLQGALGGPLEEDLYRVILIVLAFLTGLVLWGEEEEKETSRLLYSLPTSLMGSVIGKFMAGITLIFIYVVCGSLAYPLLGDQRVDLIQRLHSWPSPGLMAARTFAALFTGMLAGAISGRYIAIGAILGLVAEYGFYAITNTFSRLDADRGVLQSLVWMAMTGTALLIVVHLRRRSAFALDLSGFTDMSPTLPTNKTRRTPNIHLRLVLFPTIVAMIALVLWAYYFGLGDPSKAIILLLAVAMGAWATDKGEWESSKFFLTPLPINQWTFALKRLGFLYAGLAVYTGLVCTMMLSMEPNFYSDVRKIDMILQAQFFAIPVIFAAGTWGLIASLLLPARIIAAAFATCFTFFWLMPHASHIGPQLDFYLLTQPLVTFAWISFLDIIIPGAIFLILWAGSPMRELSSSSRSLIMAGYGIVICIWGFFLGAINPMDIYIILTN